MNICLATTWHPRGEAERLSRLLPLLLDTYSALVISLLPGDDPRVVDQFVSGRFSADSRIIIYRNDDPRTGRYMALQRAFECRPEFIHYADMDRLLHWVETRPGEWKECVEKIPGHDCIIFGRTQAAMATHPQALSSTEMISNRVVSHFLDMEIDVSGGSKSFSQSAAGYLVAHGSHDNSIGTDAEWPMLLKQAGFKLAYFQVNGLDWETADHYRPEPASPEAQKKAAADYDTDPKHWSRRIEIADTIIQSALDVRKRKTASPGLRAGKPLEFDFKAVFDVDDYLYFYREMLTDERSDAEVAALVKLLGLNPPGRILDLACGFGRHTNRLAAMGYTMVGVDLTPGFLEIARKDALVRGLNVQYQQGDMRTISFESEFDCVLLIFTAFGYFSDDENLKVLINTRKALVDGGKLVFDIHNRDNFMKSLRPFYVVEKEGNLMIDRIHFDGSTGRSYNKRIVIRDGIRKDMPFTIREYNPSEIHALLLQAGLVLDHIYAGWDGSELTPESNRMIIVAQKPLSTSMNN